MASDRLQCPNTSEVQVLSNEGTMTSKVATKAKSKSTGETAGKKLSSNKTEKLTKERDPNAPKKPANAFFWFCQEKRSEVQDKLAREGNVGHHDLAKVLSKMWGEVPNSDKKVSTKVTPTGITNLYHTHSIIENCMKRTRRDMRNNRKHTYYRKKMKHQKMLMP